MNFLVIGSGAREHIMAEKLAEVGAKVYSVLTNLNPGLIQLSKWALKANDSQSVIKLGEQYLARFPNDNHARALLTNWLLKLDQSAAIAFIDVPQSQTFIVQNWQVANNLAWLYLNSENKRRGLLFSQHAYQKQPMNSDVALTHAVALLNHNYNDKALDVLNSIKQPNWEVQQLITRLQKT